MGRTRGENELTDKQNLLDIQTGRSPTNRHKQYTTATTHMVVAIAQRTKPHSVTAGMGSGPQPSGKLQYELAQRHPHQLSGFQGLGNALPTVVTVKEFPLVVTVFPCHDVERVTVRGLRSNALQKLNPSSLARVTTPICP